jgi:hypothetical protein
MAHALPIDMGPIQNMHQQGIMMGGATMFHTIPRCYGVGVGSQDN